MSDAAKILLTSSNLYAQARSYSDAGIVTTSRQKHEPYSSPDVVRRFSSVFQRTGKFRFNWWEEDGTGTPDFAVVLEDASARLESRNGDRRAYSSLSQAIAENYGATKGVIGTVAPLLLPDLGGQNIMKAMSSKLLGLENVGQEKCHKLVVLPENTPIETMVFISMETSLLRSVEFSFTASPAKVLETIGWIRWFSPSFWKLTLMHRDVLNAEPLDHRIQISYQYADVDCEIPDDAFLQTPR